jgi:large subunit ribosomal protein L7e
MSATTSNSNASNRGKKAPYSDLPLVPESVLKKRHDLEDMARRRAATAAASAASGSGAKKGRVGHRSGGRTKTMYVKKPETILAWSRTRRNHLKRYRRVLKKGMQSRAKNSPEFSTRALSNGGAEDDEEYNEEEKTDIKEKVSSIPSNKNKELVNKAQYQTNSVGSKMVLAVRVRDGIGAPRPVLQALDRLGLDRNRTGVFARYDESTRKLLHLVEPWVVYGPPTKSLVQDLLERRGHGGRTQRLQEEDKADGEGTNGRRKRRKTAEEVEFERVPLSDNTVIERALGESCNVVCKEDLVHEIWEVGPHFDAVVGWLYPFVLEDSKTTFERRTLKIKDRRKDYGDRGEAITEYVQMVL